MTRRSQLGLSLGVTLVMLALVAGCSARRPVAATPSGQYPAGRRIVLENGMSLVVPPQWRAYIMTTGAFIATPPAESGVVGGVLDVPTRPHWGTVTFSVYGPKAGFATDTAVSESSYRKWAAKDAGDPSYSVERTTLRVDGRTSATAFVWVIGRKAGSRRYQVYASITRRGAKPLFIAADLSRLPPNVPKGAGNAELPRLLLDYLGFLTE